MLLQPSCKKEFVYLHHFVFRLDVYMLLYTSFHLAMLYLIKPL